MLGRTDASPTRHPIAPHRVMYELQISLEEATFGSMLVSRAVRAADCLTSIQFFPTSEHLLLAYGHRHSSLMKSIVIDGDITVPVYTILEFFKEMSTKEVNTNAKGIKSMYVIFGSPDYIAPEYAYTLLVKC
ncbi:hypothetical protein K7X08_025357 [Anisodus acutangulus]|uniref:Uncharacterized protein n=1 Tax=Anisodus acutangulus TaxID=402998 RepID=A0A9Q1R7M7_9SOLA|nr:hypothetical protein K7X08_025357 [Anisodus acutangulus]